MYSPIYCNDFNFEINSNNRGSYKLITKDPLKGLNFKIISCASDLAVSWQNYRIGENVDRITLVVSGIDIRIHKENDSNWKTPMPLANNIIIEFKAEKDNTELLTNITKWVSELFATLQHTNPMVGKFEKSGLSSTFEGKELFNESYKNVNSFFEAIGPGNESRLFIYPKNGEEIFKTKYPIFDIPEIEINLFYAPLENNRTRFYFDTYSYFNELTKLGKIRSVNNESNIFRSGDIDINYQRSEPINIQMFSLDVEPSNSISLIGGVSNVIINHIPLDGSTIPIPEAIFYINTNEEKVLFSVKTDNGKKFKLYILEGVNKLKTVHNNASNETEIKYEHIEESIENGKIKDRLLIKIELEEDANQSVSLNFLVIRLVEEMKALIEDINKSQDLFLSWLLQTVDLGFGIKTNNLYLSQLAELLDHYSLHKSLYDTERHRQFIITFQHKKQEFLQAIQAREGVLPDSDLYLKYKKIYDVIYQEIRENYNPLLIKYWLEYQHKIANTPISAEYFRDVFNSANARATNQMWGAITDRIKEKDKEGAPDIMKDLGMPGIANITIVGSQVIIEGLTDAMGETVEQFAAFKAGIPKDILKARNSNHGILKNIDALLTTITSFKTIFEQIQQGEESDKTAIFRAIVELRYETLFKFTSEVLKDPLKAENKNLLALSNLTEKYIGPIRVLANFINNCSQIDMYEQKILTARESRNYAVIGYYRVAQVLSAIDFASDATTTYGPPPAKAIGIVSNLFANLGLVGLDHLINGAYRSELDLVIQSSWFGIHYYSNERDKNPFYASRNDIRRQISWIYSALYPIRGSVKTVRQISAKGTTPSICTIVISLEIDKKIDKEKVKNNRLFYVSFWENSSSRLDEYTKKFMLSIDENHPEYKRKDGERILILNELDCEVHFPEYDNFYKMEIMIKNTPGKVVNDYEAPPQIDHDFQKNWVPAFRKLEIIMSMESSENLNNNFISSDLTIRKYLEDDIEGHFIFKPLDDHSIVEN